MLWTTLTGRYSRDVPHSQYLIDWEHVVSGPQKGVKDFLKPYWSTDTVLEEFRIPGSKLRVDLININESIMVEIDGTQHDNYNKFMHGSLSGYRQMIKRDLAKEKWAGFNNLKYVVIKQAEIPLLSREWIEKNFNVVL